jgi:hypothetical protein
MFRNNDLIKIEENINIIKDKAAKEYKTSFEPTLNELKRVYNVIKDYIRKRSIIVYGGFAQNLLIIDKNYDDSFYTIIDDVFYNWPDIADIEFYSPEPLKHIIELTNELYLKGFKHIDGKEGLHPETYKIFVNFINYCDISYMPKNIYDNMPTITIDGIRCSHPHFMLLDGYRIFTDPMTSYWRLDKSINRFQKLITHYPLENISKNINEINNMIKNIDNPDIIKFIQKRIIQNSKYIVIGYYAYNYYIKKVNNDIVNIPYYELITDDLEKNAIHIYNLLKNRYKQIETKEYYPFYTFMDRRIEYYYDNKLILILYGNNNRCVVYRYSDKKKTYFGTYSLVFKYLLFNYFLEYINKKNTTIVLYLISTLNKIKNEYLNSNNLTIMDETPFQYFTLKCIGIPEDPIRSALLKGLERIKKGKKIKFRYEPKGKITKIPEYTFQNSSGNEIINIKNLFFSKKKEKKYYKK